MTITDLEEKRSERQWHACAKTFGLHFENKVQGELSLYEVFSQSGQLEYSACVGAASDFSMVEEFNRYRQHYSQGASGYIGLLASNINSRQRQYDILTWLASLWVDTHHNSVLLPNPAMMGANVYYPKWLQKKPQKPLVNFLLGRREVYCGLGFTTINEQWLSAFSWFASHKLSLPVFEILRDVTQSSVLDILQSWQDDSLESQLYEKHVLNRSQWAHLQTQFFEQYPLESL